MLETSSFTLKNINDDINNINEVKSAWSNNFRYIIMTKKEHIIYAIVDNKQQNKDEIISYIGYTSNIQSRIQQHRYNKQNGFFRNINIDDANNYSFIFLNIFIPNKEIALKIETILIDYFRKADNCSPSNKEMKEYLNFLKRKYRKNITNVPLNHLLEQNTQFILKNY